MRTCSCIVASSPQRCTAGQDQRDLTPSRQGRGRSNRSRLCATCPVSWPAPALVHHMCVNHGRAQVCMPPQHLHRQLAQERLYLRRTHLLQVAVAVKQDEAPRPIDASLLRAYAVMPRAQVHAQAIEQLGWLRPRCAWPACQGWRDRKGTRSHPRNFKFA